MAPFKMHVFLIKSIVCCTKLGTWAVVYLLLNIEILFFNALYFDMEDN